MADSATCNVKGIFDDLIEIVRRNAQERNAAATDGLRIIVRKDPDPDRGTLAVRIERTQKKGYPRRLLGSLLCNDFEPWNDIWLRRDNEYETRLKPEWREGRCKLSITDHHNKQLDSIGRDGLVKVAKDFLESLLSPAQP